MACTGVTTIQYWNKHYLLENESYYDYSYESVKDNLFVIFGTHKLVRILSPSMRALPLSGLEFSYQVKEQGYQEDGYKYVTQAVDVEMGQIKESSEWEQKADQLDDMINNMEFAI